MSGIRILFLQDNGINESLALTELAAVLRRHGHLPDLLLQRHEGRRFASGIAMSGAQLVVVPCNIFGHSSVLRLVATVKRLLPGVPVLVGGTMPSFAPEFIRTDPLDLMLVGEAEVAVPELARRIADGRPYDDIPGVWVRQGDDVVDNGPAARLDDLDDIGLPARDLYYKYPFMQRFPWKKFSSGRGCHNSCTFCYNNLIRRLYHGRSFVRRKSPERVGDEVERMIAAARTRWIHFSDDLFVTEPEWQEEFSRMYRRRFSLPLSANTSADQMTRRVAQLLARAGCKVVAMGVESADEKTRMMMLNKPTTNAVIERAAEIIKSAGMKLVTFNMVGLPGETVEQAQATLEYSRRLGADATRVTMSVPMPKTAMAVKAAEEGDLSRDLAHDFSSEIDITENPYGPYYRTPEPAAMEKLLNLAFVAQRAGNRPWVGELLRRLPRQASRPFRVWMALQEQRTFEFSLADGLLFFLHVGNPWLRTTNYVALI